MKGWRLHNAGGKKTLSDLVRLERNPWGIDLRDHLKTRLRVLVVTMRIKKGRNNVGGGAMQDTVLASGRKPQNPVNLWQPEKRWEKSDGTRVPSSGSLGGKGGTRNEGRVD